MLAESRIFWAGQGVAEERYSAQILSSPEAVMALSNRAQHLLQGRESTCDPLFFLASIETPVWIPRVVSVEEAGHIVGILYAKERKYKGVPLGIYFADGSLGSMMVADEDRRERILETAIRKLWKRPGRRSLRVLMPPDSCEDVAFRKSFASDAGQPVDMRYSAVENHCVLDLPQEYECFLNSLGKQSRRNFRYYRRKSEGAGWKYVERMSPIEFREVALRLLAKDVIGADRSGLTRALNMLSCTSRPIMIGLKGEDGEWVSILGGWYEYDRAVVFCQMNNEKDYPDSSLSIVLRGYLIESLIQSGVAKLLFWAGIGPPLLRHCHFLPTTGASFDSRRIHWRLVRGLLPRINWLLSPRLKYLSSWIVD